MLECEILLHSLYMSIMHQVCIPCLQIHVCSFQMFIPSWRLHFFFFHSFIILFTLSSGNFWLTKFQCWLLEFSIFIYYNFLYLLDKRCTIFYNPYGDEKLVRLCEGNECKCMEGKFFLRCFAISFGGKMQFNALDKNILTQGKILVRTQLLSSKILH